jgi:hypothetical protein
MKSLRSIWGNILCALLILMSSAMAETKPDAAATSVLFNPPKLNRDIDLQRKTFDAQTNIINETPLNDPSLAFSVRLPKDWKKFNAGKAELDATSASDILGVLAEYVSPLNVDQQSKFRVRAGKLPFTISARNWLLNYIVTNNYTLQGLDEVSPTRIAAQYVYVDGGTQYVSRAVAQISGSKIILAETIMPISLWATERDKAVWSMISFKVTAPSTNPIEENLSYSFVDIAKFSYPKSWLLYSEPVDSIERMNAVLVNIKGGSEGRKVESTKELAALALDGRIDITSLIKKDKQSLTIEINALKENMKSLGFDVGEYLGEVKDIKTHPSVLQSRTDVYKISAPQLRLIDYELWFSVVETEGRYYILQTISIGRDNDFYAWARNMETLKLVMGSLSPVK